jgi:hypothetical protein
MRKLLISQFSRERKEKSKYTSAMYVSTNKSQNSLRQITVGG